MFRLTSEPEQSIADVIRHCSGSEDKTSLIKILVFTEHDDHVFAKYSLHCHMQRVEIYCKEFECKRQSGCNHARGGICKDKETVT